VAWSSIPCTKTSQDILHNGTLLLQQLLHAVTTRCHVWAPEQPGWLFEKLLDKEFVFAFSTMKQAGQWFDLRQQDI